ncbi:MAG: effector binding domain-containing protein [Candidatus Izimaplasma sp.]|nr:effector binding domain-containing protein [Candidatus Izimaplasma bacterium]
MEYEIKRYDTRYFAGIEKEGGITVGKTEDLSAFWEVFLDEDLALLSGIKSPLNIIGLDCYPPDFKDQKKFDYYAMVEILDPTEQSGFVIKKLPKGEYILFKISNENVQDEIRKVYQYIKQAKIKIHPGFDYEDFITTNKDIETAEVYFVLKLEERPAND